MRIAQDVTFERQGFEATLTLRNGSESADVVRFRADVEVRDMHGAPVTATNDPSAAGALFFVRLDSSAGAGSVDGDGRVPAGTTATIRWTLIPSVGAGGVTPLGVAYHVGARIGYEVDGTAHALVVSPDLIWVAPMPEIAIDCFVPARFYGDDPWSAEIEPSLPGTLGMRLRNVGLGKVRGMSVTATPPVIVDNRTGLPIEFTLLSSAVNGLTAGRGFRVELGDADPGGCVVASWRLRSPLMGICSNLGVRVSHADSLGGAVTALIRPENVRSHVSIREVLVDLPGKDDMEDFLAPDGMVYESDGADVPWVAAEVDGVLRQEDGSLMVELQPVTTGTYAYARLDAWDSNAAGWTPATVLRAVRDDGRTIPEQNVWVALDMEEGGTWTASLHLFDASVRGGRYRIAAAAIDSEDAPVIVCDSRHATRVEQWLHFEVHATSSTDGMPSLSADRIPAGATFEDVGGGRATFAWRPTEAQEGEYNVRMHAASGSKRTSRTVRVEVFAAPAFQPGSLFQIH